MPPFLTGVVAFVAVVHAGSFVRAGVALDLTTSAVSRAVARLERELGVRLLERTTRKVALTEEGRAYFSHCEHLLDAFDQAGEAVRQRRGTVAGRLRVEVPVSFGRMVLIPALPASGGSSRHRATGRHDGSYCRPHRGRYRRSRPDRRAA